MVAALGVAGYLLAVRPGPPTAAGRAKAGDGTPAAAATSTTVPPAPADVFDAAAVAGYLAGQQSSNVTAAVFDADTGAISLYRPGVVEEEASIMKVDILATLLAQSQSADEPLTSDQMALAQQMIEESNNDDAQDLWDAEGGASAVAAFNQRVGMSQTAPNVEGYWGLSTTTAADQLRLLQTVAYPNALLTDASRTYEMGLMTHVDPTQAWGVSAGVPAGVTVAIKNGWLPLDQGGWQVNSLGIIEGQGRDYVIAVLTNPPTEQQGIDAIEGLSSLVWQELAPPTSSRHTA